MFTRACTLTHPHTLTPFTPTLAHTTHSSAVGQGVQTCAVCRLTSVRGLRGAGGHIWSRAAIALPGAVSWAFSWAWARAFPGAWARRLRFSAEEELPTEQVQGVVRQVPDVHEAALQ